jgi:hypothetical protein
MPRKPGWRSREKAKANLAAAAANAAPPHVAAPPPVSGDAAPGAATATATAVRLGAGWADLARLREVIEVASDDDWSSLVVPNKPPNFQVYNPSIVPDPSDPSRFLVVLRTANYEITDEFRYIVPHSKTGDIQTLNFVVSIPANPKSQADARGDALTALRAALAKDGDGKVSAAEIIELAKPQAPDAGWRHLGPMKTPAMPYPFPRIAGWEDVRLQTDPDNPKRVYLSFTSLEMTQHHMPAISLATLDLTTMTASKPVRLHGSRPAWQKEKNWMSFVRHGALYFVYMLNPLTIVRANAETGECPIVIQHPLNHILPSNWSGSSPLLPLHMPLRRLLAPSEELADEGDWFIALGHTAQFPRYASFFVVLRCTGPKDGDMAVAITHYSPRFVFDKHEIEYALSLALTPDGGEFVLPYSRRDRNCHCMRIKPSALLPRLIPIRPKSSSS